MIAWLKSHHSEKLEIAKNLEALNVWNQFFVHFEIINRCVAVSHQWGERGPRTGLQAADRHKTLLRHQLKGTQAQRGIKTCLMVFRFPVRCPVDKNLTSWCEWDLAGSCDMVRDRSKPMGRHYRNDKMCGLRRSKREQYNKGHFTNWFI